MFGGPEGCLEAVGNIDLFKDIVYMGLYRIGADEELIGNILDSGPYGYHGEYLHLP